MKAPSYEGQIPDTYINVWAKSNGGINLTSSSIVLLREGLTAGCVYANGGRVSSCCINAPVKEGFLGGQV